MTGTGDIRIQKLMDLRTGSQSGNNSGTRSRNQGKTALQMSLLITQRNPAEEYLAIAKTGITERYHEGIGNITPRDKYPGLETKILQRRKKIKKITMNKRLEYFRQQKEKTCQQTAGEV